MEFICSVILLLNVLLAVRGLDNGLARLPPMGWMSWSKFYCEIDCDRHPHSCINEQLYKDMANRMAEDGYREAGYEYVHIDDCWMASSRSADGKLVEDKTRFPSGIPALADYAHIRGLKFGIYGDVGTQTCEGYPGSFGHFKQDAQTFAEWKVDYLKLDGCNLDLVEHPEAFPEMSRYLLQSGRPIAYSCGWPLYLLKHPDKARDIQFLPINYTTIAKYCNSWRNYYDVTPSYVRSWANILSIIDWYTANQDVLIPVHGPGQWNDPDMILAGNTEITHDQARAQMSLWVIWSAPLIMSNDLRTIDPESREILLNRGVIAIDQDPLGIMGRMVLRVSNVYVYVKPVTPVDDAHKRYSYAVAIFNRGTSPATIKFALKNVGLTNRDGYNVQELWSGRMGRYMPNDTYAASLNPTSAELLKATLWDLKTMQLEPSVDVHRRTFQQEL
ncbi:Melibiase family protein [Aphelenchoides avenae]|nr:Melibiase family protein [Aphelenchus avenae]